ncbi:MAG: OB-fold nucleic acid binding domain-containing protein [archaeon GB-1867-005]|nr:OB-fold nucleic acid binding domain-containing protein [Candidatus Culexmicrobium cathedralense]
MSTVKIKDLKPGMKNLTIEGLIIKKWDVPRLTKRLAKAILRDETGEIILNLWREQADQVNVGDYIRVIEAFVKSYKGILELNTWKDIIVMKKSDLANINANIS